MMMGETIIKTRNLPKGAKTMQYVHDSKTNERKEVIMEFQRMDGMYGKRLGDDGEIYNFNGDFVKKGKFYLMKKMEEK